MNPSDEAALWEEIERLREQLDEANARHAAALGEIRKRISGLEARLRDGNAQQVVSAAPPPLPKTEETPPPQLQSPTPLAAQPIIPPEPKMAPVKIVEEASKEVVSEDNSFELQFGKVWFVRIGIVILLTGLVFLGNYAYQNWIREMPNGVRLAALFACALGLVETGRRLAAKENLHRFGEVLLAGGMAFFYYCTFAAHHVGRLKVIDSPSLAAVLLFGAAGAIAAVSWLRQAKATAVLGIVLASYSTMLQPIGWMSCVSNILLGAVGLFLMLKPGWTGPGWASMLGSYGAFFGWQLLGASGQNLRTEDPAALFFLPPLWVMFAIPGTLGRFRKSLSDRARAWFTGANNALFFLLFSGIWLARYGGDNYWLVAAVFGPALIALGILGRRQSTTAGGVNIAQGLAVATFALILKLDGHHLALVLAFESLALAMAAWRYRGKSEAVFSLLAGLGGFFLLAENAFSIPLAAPIPVWSGFLAAALLAVASFVTTRIRTAGKIFTPFLRASSGLIFTAAALIAGQLCVIRLETNTGLLTAITLSGLLSFAYLRLDTKRRQPEIVWSGLWFLGIGAWLGFQGDAVWPLAIAAAVSLAASWLWHRQPVSETTEPTSDLAKVPAIPAWAFSVGVPLFLWQLASHLRPGYQHIFLTCQIFALGLAAVAIALRCHRVTFTAALSGFLALPLIAFPGSVSLWHLFAAAALAVAGGIMFLSPFAEKNIAARHRQPGGWLFRATAFIAYCAAWHRFAPGVWSDWLALTSLLLTLATLFLKRKLLPESVALAAVSVLTLVIATANSPWHLSPEQTGWRGGTVVLALLALALTYRQRPALITNPEIRARAIAAIAGVTCAVTTVWATQMLVWRFGWKPSAVLWTVLGFAFVSAGLWQRLHILRVCGFLLLVVSFIKLFAVDVWDFTAFMRVASFIVLGAALILLGLFYNKFADTIKALLDDERGAKPSPPE